MIGSIRYPNITGATEAAQLMQLKSYLHQLVDQLNIAMADVEIVASTAAPVAVNSVRPVSASEEAENTFNSIKSLIIKSADIVEAYSEKISETLNGVYVAKSNFGTYAESTVLNIVKTDKEIKETFDNVRTIESDVEGIQNQLIETDAYIKRGLLAEENGVPIYGIEVGQTTENENGEQIFEKYARFTADKLSFYDQNGYPVAYISGTKLYITHAHVTGSFVLGGFVDTVDPEDGTVVTKWIGKKTTGGET